jgi:hypothetical protein
MRGKPGLGLVCVAMLLLVPDRARAEGSARPNDAIQRTTWAPRQRAAEILAVAAGLSTLAGFAGSSGGPGLSPTTSPTGRRSSPAPFACKPSQRTSPCGASSRAPPLPAPRSRWPWPSRACAVLTWRWHHASVGSGSPALGDEAGRAPHGLRVSAALRPKLCVAGRSSFDTLSEEAGAPVTSRRSPEPTAQRREHGWSWPWRWWRRRGCDGRTG